MEKFPNPYNNISSSGQENNSANGLNKENLIDADSVAESEYSYEEIEKNESDNALELLSDDELENTARHFLGEEITSLTQEEIETKITPLLTELAKRGISGFDFALPDNVTAEEIQSGNSSWAKVYKSLFNLSKTDGIHI